MKKQAPKKKPSGAAYRKMRRAKDKDAGIVKRLVNMPYVGKIRTLNDWHIQIARIYRRVLTGEIPDYVATKLVYIVTGGANIAKALDEQRDIKELREQLARVEARQNGIPLLNGQDFLPAGDSQPIGDEE